MYRGRLSLQAVPRMGFVSALAGASLRKLGASYGASAEPASRGASSRKLRASYAASFALTSGTQR